MQKLLLNCKNITKADIVGKLQFHVFTIHIEWIDNRLAFTLELFTHRPPLNRADFSLQPPLHQSNLSQLHRPQPPNGPKLFESIAQFGCFEVILCCPSELLDLL